MVLTSFRFQYNPGKPKEIFYRQYKNFDKIAFENELKLAFQDEQFNDYGLFENKFIEIYDKYAPLKKKTVRANNAPYMTRTLRKAMMKRTELANKYNKSRTLDDYNKFRKHRNYVNRLYTREREKNLF